MTISYIHMLRILRHKQKLLLGKHNMQNKICNVCEVIKHNRGLRTISKQNQQENRNNEERVTVITINNCNHGQVKWTFITHAKPQKIVGRTYL